MFATLESVKKLDGTFKATARDSDLELTIEGVNSKVEDMLDRVLIVAETVEELDMHPTRTTSYKLRAYPVSSVSEVMIDDTVIDTDGYRLNKLTGRLQIFAPYSVGLSLLKVTYTGGMAVDATTLRTTFPTLVYACCMQSIFEFTRKNSLSHSAIAINDGGTETLVAYKLLPEVRRMIRKYRRRQLVA